MRTEKIISFDINPTHYDLSDNGAVIVWCFDSRLNQTSHSALDVLIRENSWDYKDLITEPGGAKILASANETDSAEKQSLLDRINSGIRLHHAKRVLLTVHIDCGAYGYSRSFAEGAEEDKLIHDLTQAGEFLNGKIPQDVAVELWLVKMDGLYKIHQ